jgi:ZIP family zinc transporter
MIILLFAFAGATFVFTVLGGFFAYRVQDKLHLVIGFSAGVLITAAFIDILPESYKLAGGTAVALETILMVTIFGFLGFHLLERFLIMHSCNDGSCENVLHVRSAGKLAAGSLVFHSLLDGCMIGLAFKAGLSFGILIGIAVITHDWTDGVNVVAVLLPSGQKWRQMVGWVVADAIAPVIGVFVYFIGIPAGMLAVMLAFTAGIFIYIAAANLLPEAHHRHSSIPTLVATLIGCGLIFALSKFVF